MACYFVVWFNCHEFHIKLKYGQLHEQLHLGSIFIQAEWNVSWCAALLWYTTKRQKLKQRKQNGQYKSLIVQYRDKLKRVSPGVVKIYKAEKISANFNIRKLVYFGEPCWQRKPCMIKRSINKSKLSSHHTDITWTYSDDFYTFMVNWHSASSKLFYVDVVINRGLDPDADLANIC